MFSDHYHGLCNYIINDANMVVMTESKLEDFSKMIDT